MRDKKVQFIVEAAAIAAIYVVLTVVFSAISFGEVQLRFSEALTILPYFTPAAIPGLFVGCLIGNLFGGAIPLDIIFGSLATLIGACGTYALRKQNKFLAPPHCGKHHCCAPGTVLWLWSEYSHSDSDAHGRPGRSVILRRARHDPAFCSGKISRCDL